MKEFNFYHPLSTEAQKDKIFFWEIKQTLPFQEIIIGWNALRPARGQYHLSISLYIEGWSSWFPFAEWGADIQRSFELNESPIQIFQDTIKIEEGYKATGWRIKIEGSQLTGFHALYASIPPPSATEPSNYADICLDVPKISQMLLTDPRHMRVCSPTSTTAVIHYLNQKSTLSPLEMANKVRDKGFDIYGHWVFAAAQAYIELEGRWAVCVQYLDSFKTLHHFLMQGLPCVVSVKGPLTGSLFPYEQGHLLVVRGFDSKTKEVLCMDPGYLSLDATYAAYPLSSFLNAWNRRKNIAYTFNRMANMVNVPID